MKDISDLMIGEKVEGVYILDNLSSSAGKLTCTLKDKSGEADGQLPSDADQTFLSGLVNGAVKVSFIVKPGKNGRKAVLIKSIDKPVKSEYKNSDLFTGLSEATVEKYVSSIRQNIAHVFQKNKALGEIMKYAFSEKTFEMLKKYPGTVRSLATYEGGALALTANVLEQVKNIGVSYVRLANGIYADNIDWALCLSAAALICYAVDEAYTNEEPYTKRNSCIERGYGSLLQSKLDRLIVTNALELDEEIYSKLLNCLWCVVEQHARISPTCKEGVLLQMAYSTYSRLDSFDLYKADVVADNENGYSYSAQQKMYVSTKEVVMSEASAS